MIERRDLARVSLLAGMLVGCAHDDGPPVEDDSQGIGTGGMDSGAMGSGDGDTGPGGQEGGDGDPTALCDQSDVTGPMLRRLTGQEFVATLGRVFPQVAGQWTSAFRGDVVSSLGFTNESGTLAVTRQNAREIDDTAAAVAGAVVASIDQVLPCAATTGDRACAAEFVVTYGRRLFRRGVSAQESELMLGFFDQAVAVTDFPTAIGWVTRALIHSPAAVYRSEIGQVQGGERLLTQHEIATALSFAFAGVTPSDALLARADAGELNSPEVLRQVAVELLASPEGREHIQAFFGAWLEYGRVTSVTKSALADFNTLREDMSQETRRFIQAVVFDEGGGLRELLTAPVTYPSIELASMYGLPTPASDYAAVARPETQGIGILAQGSVLATESTPNSSSPTQRGLLVMEKLMCLQPPAVPADVPPLSEPAVGVTTTRQRYEEQHAVGACWSCHKSFDPIGFGFEHFDELGRYRAEEGGLPIDSRSHVPAGASMLFEFDGQAQLAQGLGEQTLVQSCVSGQVKAYAFGSQDSCLGETEREAFMQGAIGFVDYLSSLALEPQFTRRKLD